MLHQNCRFLSHEGTFIFNFRVQRYGKFLKYANFCKILKKKHNPGGLCYGVRRRVCALANFGYQSDGKTIETFLMVAWTDTSFAKEDIAGFVNLVLFRIISC